MSHRAIALAALAAALVTAPAAVHAQQSPVRFGLAAGATFPTGDYGDAFEWGYHLGASITGKPMLSPVGIRGEVMWNSLNAKDDVDAKLNVLAGIVNAEIGMSGVSARPYFIGGLGVYRVDIDSDALDAVLGPSEAETKFGFNVGAGIDFPLAGFSAFTEARFHSIQTEGGATNIVPLTFGLRF